MSEETTNEGHLDLAELFTAAAADITDLQARLGEQDNPTDRRALVRAVFAFVESMLFALKQEALKQPANFTSPEVALLREECYELGDDGVARVRAARLALKRNLKFTFASFAKAWRTRNRLDLGGPGWQDLESAMKIRHRLMHPKRIPDLDLSEEEIRTVNQAFAWFVKMYAFAIAGALGEWWKQGKAMDLAVENRSTAKSGGLATPSRVHP